MIVLKKINHRLLFTSLLFVLSLMLYSQNDNSIEQLQQKLKLAQDDTSKVIVLNKLSKELMGLDPVKAYEYLKEAQIISKRAEYKKGNAEAILLLGYYHFLQSDFTKAENYYNNAKYIFSSINDKHGISKCHLRLGFMLARKSDFVQAIKHHRKVLEIGDKNSLASAYNGIANVYSYQGNFTKSLENYFEALKIYESTNSKKGIADVYINIGIVFDRQQDSSAIDYYKKALLIYEELNHIIGISFCKNNIGSYYLSKENGDLAMKYYKESYELQKKLNDKEGVAFNLMNMGNVFVMKEEYGKAHNSFIEAKIIFNELGIRYQETELLIALSNLYSLSGKNSKAINTFLEALAISKEIKALEQQKFIHHELYKRYTESNNNTNAFKHYYEYSSIKDSLFNLEKVDLIENLRVKYETEKMEEEILNYKKEQEFHEKTRKYLVIIIFILIFSIFVGVYSFILRMNNAKQSLNLIAAEKQKQELELEKQELENTNLKMDLQFKKKELTSNTMQLVQFNEQNNKVTEELDKLRVFIKSDNDVAQKTLNSAINQLSTKANDNIWKEFELRFQDVHKEFYDTLTVKFPDLSPNELKICAFLRLNMSTKDISTITFQTPNSLRVARTRLRKKLGISSEDNLISFLSSL